MGEGEETKVKRSAQRLNPLAGRLPPNSGSEIKVSLTVFLVPSTKKAQIEEVRDQKVLFTEFD